MNINRKLLIKISIAVIILLFVFFVIFIFVSNYKPEYTITLNPKKKTMITLGTQYRDTPTIDKEIIKTSLKTTKKLSISNYVIKFSGDDYESVYKIVYLDKDTEIPTPNLDYSKEKLSELLLKESEKIHNLILSKVDKFYTIKDESLYKTGNWYSARLESSDATKDDLKIILKKVNNKWQIAAKPSIVFYIDDYPKVPQDIIRSTNKLIRDEDTIYYLLRQ